MPDPTSTPQGHPALFDALDDIRSDIDVAAFLGRVARAFGFAGFMMVDIPSATDAHLLPKIGLSDMPAGLLDDYDRLGLLRNSPTFANLRRSTVPVVWSLDNLNDGRPDDEARQTLELFRRHGLSTGIFIPVHAPDGARAAIGFDGGRPPLSHLEIGELALLVAYAYQIYCGLRGNERSEGGNLTGRELEVLHWAASGKTSTEIAAILSLSDHTVNTYMNTAMRKLDCVNRTQLVAKALRLRLIS